MSDSKIDEKFDKNLDAFMDTLPKFFGCMFAIWLLAGISPYVLSNWNFSTSGQIGDMFGLSNSLFSGFGFSVAMIALVLQIRETRESGKRRLEEDEFKAEEMRLANENIKLQVQMREDDKQNVLTKCLVKANKNATRFAIAATNIETEFHIEAQSPAGENRMWRNWDQAKAEQTRATIEIQDSALELQLILGDDSKPILEWITEMVVLAKGANFAEGVFPSGEVSTCAENLRHEVTKFWSRNVEQAR